MSLLDGTGLLGSKVEGHEAAGGLVVLAQLVLGVLVHHGKSAGNVLAHRADAGHPGSLATGSGLRHTQLGKLLL